MRPTRHRPASVRGCLPRFVSVSDELPGDAIGPLAGGGDGGVAGAELVAQLGGSNPGGDGPLAPGQDRPEEHKGEPGADRRSRAEASRENHWHGADIGCEDVIGGRLRSGCLAGMATAIVPTGPALEAPQRQDAAATRFLKFCEMVPK
jgi:hypothetical protein